MTNLVLDIRLWCSCEMEMSGGYLVDLYRAQRRPEME